MAIRMSSHINRLNRYLSSMAQLTQAFEASNSWCYQFARYQALPEIIAMPEVASGAPFRLIELSRRVLNTYLTPEQQAQQFIRAQSGQSMSVAAAVKFYIPFIAKNTGQLTNLGSGTFRLPTAEDLNEDDIEDAAFEAGEEEAGEFDGWIYAFSFPVLVKEGEAFPIKVGKTTGDVEARVTSQCRSSACFDNPVILARWQVKRVGAMESAIHNVLKARGQWRDNVPGVEWFDCRVSDVDQIIKFVQAK